MAAAQNAQKQQQQKEQKAAAPAKTAASSSPPAPAPAPPAQEQQQQQKKAPAQEQQQKKTPAPPSQAAPPAEEHPAVSGAEGAQTENPLTEFAATLKTLTAQFKALQTAYTRIEKELQKKQHQSNQKKQNRGDNSKKGVTPPGFMKPVKLSKELGAMLGKPEGSTMPRNEVNNAIHAYIRDNNLQKEDDRRDIVPDAKLLALFKPGTYNPDEIDPKTGKKKKLTHFVLQGLIKHHFIKMDEPTDK